MYYAGGYHDPSFDGPGFGDSKVVAKAGVEASMTESLDVFVEHISMPDRVEHGHGLNYIGIKMSAELW